MPFLLYLGFSDFNNETAERSFRETYTQHTSQKVYLWRCRYARNALHLGMSVAQICRAELIRARAQFTKLCLSYVFGGCECFIWMHVEESIKEYSNTIREASHSSQSRLLSQSHYPLHMVVSQYTGKTCLPLFCIKIFLMWHIWFFSFHPPNYMFFFCIQKGKKQSKNKNQNKQNDKTKKSKQTHTHTQMEFTLCWLTALRHGACHGMWLIFLILRSSQWNFSFPEALNCKQLLG